MPVIAAKFPHDGNARSAAAALHAAGFRHTQIKGLPVQAVERTGVNDAAEGVEISPNPAVSQGAEESGSTAAVGAAVGVAVGLVAGAVAAPLVGPAAVAVGAGVGAYTGSLVGALAGLEEAAPPALAGDAHRVDSKVLEVTLDTPDDRPQIVRILNSHGATTVTDI